MRLRDKFPDLKPQEISYNSEGLIIRTELLPSSNPRMEFIEALQEWEGEENNAFETMPNGTRIQVDTKIGENVKYGANCTFGGSGFGYEPDAFGDLIRMPHFGSVIISDNVTIHNNVNIDRGVLESTYIGKGTKIDSLSHVAHGAVIGERCVIIGAGIGGSVIIGNNCYIGFRAVIKNKVKIGNKVTIGMGAVVIRDVPDGETWIGNPARKLEKRK
jgi:UDP-3-O-[3-hydroxymyristoyl] glucosamine N-acyltransferase